MRRVLLLVCTFLSIYFPAFAVQPNEMLADPHLEARARAISSDLRCLVCQNQSIDDSDADLAHDLRIVVRQRLQAGDTDEQIKNYLVARYGNYVLLHPPLNPTTVVLWAGPAILLIIACALIVGTLSRRKVDGDHASALSKDELRQVVQLMQKDKLP